MNNIIISGGSFSLKRLIKRCITVALEKENITIPCEINVLITDDSVIRNLNTIYRNNNEPTDVLSFPAWDLTPGEPLPTEYIDPETGFFPLGDMALSLERAKAQAEEYGHSAKREAGYLSVHSVLHLLGHDHMDEGDKAIMRVREEKIMSSLGLIR